MKSVWLLSSLTRCRAVSCSASVPPSVKLSVNLRGPVPSYLVPELTVPNNRDAANMIMRVMNGARAFNQYDGQPAALGWSRASLDFAPVFQPDGRIRLHYEVRTLTPAIATYEPVPGSVSQPMEGSIIQVPTLQQNFDQGDILVQPGVPVELHLSAGVVLSLVAST